MEIVVGNLFDNEGNHMSTEVFVARNGGDFTEILDFFTNLKAEFGHGVITRRSTQILFTDGVRLHLTNSEAMEMKDVEEFNGIKAIDRERVSQPTNGIVLESESTVEKP